MVKISHFLYRKTPKPARGPHFARRISWEPSLLLTNGKKQQFPTDLYFKIDLSCFRPPKNGLALRDPHINIKVQVSAIFSQNLFTCTYQASHSETAGKAWIWINFLTISLSSCPFLHCAWRSVASQGVLLQLFWVEDMHHHYLAGENWDLRKPE